MDAKLAEQLFKRLSVSEEPQAKLKKQELAYPPPVPPPTPTNSSKTDGTTSSGNVIKTFKFLSDFVSNFLFR